MEGSSKKHNKEEKQKSSIAKGRSKVKTMKQNGFKFKRTSIYKCECISRCDANSQMNFARKSSRIHGRGHNGGRSKGHSVEQGAIPW